MKKRKIREDHSQRGPTPRWSYIPAAKGWIVRTRTCIFDSPLCATITNMRSRLFPRLCAHELYYWLGQYFRLRRVHSPSKAKDNGIAVSSGKHLSGGISLGPVIFTATCLWLCLWHATATLANSFCFPPEISRLSYLRSNVCSRMSRFYGNFANIK